MIKRGKKKEVSKWANTPEEAEKELVVKAKGKTRGRSKKSIYDGINFDSQLEVYCYKALKLAGLKFEYTQKEFVISPAFKYTGESYEPDKRKGDGMYLKSNSLQSIKYTPDFVGDTWIIETKGLMNETFPMRWKLFKQHLVEKGLKYDLYMPKNHKQVDECITIIKSKM